MSRPTLSLAEIDAFDPQGPPARKWCPLCGNDKPKDTAHRSLSIERTHGLWKCFRCGESGLAKEFWSHDTQITFNQKRQHLKKAFAIPPAEPLLLPSNSPEELQREAVTSTEVTVPEVTATKASDWETAWNSTEPLTTVLGGVYLLSRKIPLPVAQDAGVRWSANWSGNPSVVFPIRRRDETIIAAQGRAVRGSAKITRGPKKEGAFFAPVVMGTGRLCGPFDEILPSIILVEAPIDALSLAACGFPALALCGTSGPAWLHIACGLRDVALAFDADEAGDKAALESEKWLTPYGARCTRLRPEGFKDWNENLIAIGRAKLSDWLVAQLLAA